MGLAPLADIVVTDCNPVSWLRVAGLNTERDERTLIGPESSTSDSIGLPGSLVASMKGIRGDFTVVIDVADELLW